ncbi:MAG: pilin [Patescibacteria group bacterium]
MPKLFLFILIIFGLALPFLVLAGNLSGPLVPCGTKASGRDCTLCDIFVMIQNIIDFILIAIFIIAPVFIVVGGVIILSSTGIPERVGLGKRIVFNTIIGLAIALLSWTILNMLFNVLLPSGGFPWPWNEVRCVGGGITSEQWRVYCVCEYVSANSDNNIRATQISGYGDNLYTCQKLCTSTSSVTYCGSAARVGTENMYCVNASDSRLNRKTACMSQQEGWARVGSSCYAALQDCNSAADIQFHSTCYDASGTLQCQCNSDAPTGVTDPCTSDNQTWTLFKYSPSTFISCYNDIVSCSNNIGSGCDFCELGCPTGTTPSVQWCQRAAPSGSNVWILNGINSGQKGDVSPQLASFLNCMYRRIPNLQITSISSNILCNNPSCDISGYDCGHTANSCHFGGTNCTGYSYAVDFATNVPCSIIKSNALACNSSAWVNWENNHTHVSINNTACGCNEGGTPTSCPN